MCRQFKKFIKIFSRIICCIFCCRWRKRAEMPVAVDLTKKKKKKSVALTSIRIDEGFVKGLMAPKIAPSWAEQHQNDLNSDAISIATTNTENFDMMESFSKDVDINTLQNSRQLGFRGNSPKENNFSRKVIIGRSKEPKPDPVNLGIDYSVNNLISLAKDGANTIGSNINISTEQIKNKILKKKADKQN